MTSEERSRIEAEAAEAVAAPGWVIAVGIACAIAAVVLSAVWPWGWGIAP